MKNKEIIFVETGLASDLARLATHIEGHLKKDTISVNTNEWKGCIKQIELESGLYLQYWNCYLSVPTTLYYYPAPPNSSVICSLIYNLNPGSVIFENPSSSDIALVRWANTIFLNNSSRALFGLVPRKNLQLIYLSMTKEWIMRQFRHTDKRFIQSIQECTTKRIEPFPVNCSATEYTMVNEIYERFPGGIVNTLFVQSRVYLLISSFFEKFLTSKQATAGHFGYFKKIRQAEMILSMHLQSPLPSLRSIAENTGLSESQLKRYFKIMYGNNIYEYYLQQKMELAKRLLIEKNMSVNEVASHLQYGNVSSFIEVFKKQFGYLPGVIRKNN